MSRVHPGWIRGAGYFLAILGFYLLLASKLNLTEFVAGLGVAGAGTFLCLWLRSNLQRSFRLPPGWAWIFLRRIPAKAFLDCGWVFLSLWRYLIFRKPIEGRLISLPFEPGGEDAVSAARRALVLSLVSLTPNTVSISIDREKRVLLIHQLVPTGEKPGRGDEKWPL